MKRYVRYWVALYSPAPFLEIGQSETFTSKKCNLPFLWKALVDLHLMLGHHIKLVVEHLSYGIEDAI